MTDERQWSDEQNHATLAEIYEDLVTLRDVAKKLDVRIERVYRWVDRRDKTRCPLPVRVLSIADIYSMQEWRKWFARWMTKPRRANINPAFQIRKGGGYQPHRNSPPEPSR